MLWGILVSFGLRLGFNCSEELGGHHLRCALQHSLSNACYRPADLNLAAVSDYGYVVLPREIQITGAFQETGLTFSIDYHSKMMRRPEIFKPHIPGEKPFYCAHSRAERCGVRILPGLLEPLATRYASLQHRGVD